MKITYALAENITNPELFTGRKEIMENFGQWVKNIRKGLGKSRALLSRRKKGKTAIMQRLYNIVWTQNDTVVPFFYEIKERNMSLGDFSINFFSSFLNQYYAFVSRQPDYVANILTLEELSEHSFSGDKFISNSVNTFKLLIKNDNHSELWEYARKFPHALAANKNIKVLQIIDEFQNINKYIIDRHTNLPMTTLAGSYLGTAESRLAPLFVSGSYIGWLRRIIWELLPARFNEFFLGNLEEVAGIELILKCARLYEIPVTAKNAEYILGLTQGDPYYISIIFEGTYLGKKDFTDINNINDVYEYEITKGNIRGTWLEYLHKAFKEVNNLNAKRMVLYLFNANGEERTREQIATDLKLEITDTDLEAKLKSLVYADIISQGESNFDYMVSNDKIYEMVFRNIYQKEIDKIGEDVRKTLRKEIGKFSYDFGHFCEYKFESIFNTGFNIKDIAYTNDNFIVKAGGEIYRNYFYKQTRLRNIEIDLYGKTDDKTEVFIEIKSWKRKTGKNNIEKYIKLKQQIENKKANAIILIYAIHGFTNDALEALTQNGIYYGDNQHYQLLP